MVDPNAADPTRASARLATSPVIVVEGAQGSLAQGGAVILASTAARLPAPVSREVAHVFPRLTPEQQAVAAVGVVLALIYSLQAGAAGRRVLAGARAMGLRRWWVRSVLGWEIAWVVLAPTAAGVVGSALGVLTVTALQGVLLDLHVPWMLVGIMAGGTVLAFVGALWLALQNLSVHERME